MKVLLLLYLLLHPWDRAWSDFYVAPGVGLTLPHTTVEQNELGEELVDFREGLGLSLDLEYTFGSFSIVISGLWRGNEATTQYSFTNPADPFDAATVRDLKTNSSTLIGHLGPRFRFIDGEYIKSFVGAGFLKGVLYLTYDEDHFKVVTGSDVGLVEKEDAALDGHYLEVGIEFTSRRGGAVRFFGRHSEVYSDSFSTLDGRALTLKTTMIAVQYMHPVR